MTVLLWQALGMILKGGEEQPDILGSLYDETQRWIMENYPDSYAAQTYIAAAEELVNGTDAQSGKTATTPTSITRPQGMRVSCGAGR